MRIGLGSDGIGFECKERLKARFARQGHSTHDVCAADPGGSDYQSTFRDFLKERYKGADFDLIIAVADLRKSAAAHASTSRPDRDLNGKVVFGGTAVVFLCMVLLYNYFSGSLSAGLTAALVMIVVGFFFAAVSGNLCGMIGSSNNPVSGLTLCTLIIAALLMVAIGVPRGRMKS